MRISLGWIVFLTFGITSTLNAEISYDTVAVTGQPVTVSGFPATLGTTLSVSPITNDGRVLLGSLVNVPNHLSINYATFSATTNFSAVNYETQQAPGTQSGVNFVFLSPQLSINSAGRVAFTGGLTGPGTDFTNASGIWLEKAGSGLSLVARKGQQPPGTSSGTVFQTLQSFVHNDLDQLAFFSILSGSAVNANNSSSIWMEGSNGLTLMARTDQQAQGMGAGITFQSFDSNISLNNSGKLVFGANYANSSFSTFGSGIWTGTNPANLAPTLLSGQPAPGVGVGSTFSSFSGIAINDPGSVAFGASFQTSPSTFGNNSGIWSNTGTGPRLIARAGQQPPGISSENLTFSLMNSSGILLNSVGRVAFNTYLAQGGLSTASRGIFVETESGLSLVAHKNQQVPNMSAGTLFNDLSRLDFNALGQIAFTATLTGTGVNAFNDQSIWAMNTDGQLQLVVRKGALFDVNDDTVIEDLRTISSLEFINLNDQGKLLFQASFNGGSSGVFVALVPIPEPSTFLLASVGVAGLAIAVKRNRKS